MKKLQGLGRSLNKDEQKKISGGRIWPEVGWRLDGSNCYCDYMYTYANGSTVTECNVPCATLCCSSSMSCYKQD